jgi:hypothetical protein
MRDLPVCSIIYIYIYIYIHTKLKELGRNNWTVVAKIAPKNWKIYIFHLKMSRRGRNMLCVWKSNKTFRKILLQLTAPPKIISYRHKRMQPSKIKKKNGVRKLWNEWKLRIKMTGRIFTSRSPWNCRRYSDWLITRRSKGRSSSLGGVKNFPLSTSSKPKLCPTQHHVQWV